MKGRMGIHVTLGLLQGVALWLLYEAHEAKAWPATGDAGFAFWAAALAGPLAWYLSIDRDARPLARPAIALAIGAFFALLGWHEGRTHGGGWPPSLAPDRLLAGAVLGFLLVALAAGFDPARRRFDYPRLFEVAWRNALLVPVAGLLTGILWALLWAAAALMKTVGVEALRKLLEQPAFIIIASSVSFGTALGVATHRAEALVTVRRFWLALTAWFLPLALAFAVAWVIALTGGGTSDLFGTGVAALMLFWFAALTVTFANAAFQDGAEPPAFPRPLLRALPWAWLAMLPLAAVGLWALGLRVQQHGWTPDRIWAAVVGVLVLVYAVGYAGSLLRRAHWMGTMAATNVAAALLLVLALVALLSPLADTRKLTVASQLARLHAGVADVDLAFLALGTGSYGRQALQALAAQGSGASEAVRTQASLALSARDRDGLQDAEAALATLRGRVRVVPAQAVPDPALLQWFARADADWIERTCVRLPQRCALWVTELDGQAPPEVVLLVEQKGSASATLYAREPEGWRRQGQLHGHAMALSAWLELAEREAAPTVAPRWPDLMIGGSRVQVR